jgi:hypothetical protein
VHLGVAFKHEHETRVWRQPEVHERCVEAPLTLQSGVELPAESAFAHRQRPCAPTAHEVFVMSEEDLRCDSEVDCETSVTFELAPPLRVCLPDDVEPPAERIEPIGALK